jgi:hypothetical protein
MITALPVKAGRFAATAVAPGVGTGDGGVGGGATLGLADDDGCALGGGREGGSGYNDNG